VNQNPVFINCTFPSGNNATSCPSTTLHNSGYPCYGCMDTTSILAGKSASTVLSDLNLRYTAPGCSTFNNDLANVWNNYYLVKSQAMSPIASRASIASTSLLAYTNSLVYNINPTFKNVMNTLTQSAATITDPTYGLAAGINCKVIGEDV